MELACISSKLKYIACVEGKAGKTGHGPNLVIFPN